MRIPEKPKIFLKKIQNCPIKKNFDSFLRSRNTIKILLNNKFGINHPNYN